MPFEGRQQPFLKHMPRFLRFDNRFPDIAIQKFQTRISSYRFISAKNPLLKYARIYFYNIPK